MHMQSILQCTALYVIVNFIVFALEQSTIYRGIGCLFVRSLACLLCRSIWFSMLLVPPSLSICALSIVGSIWYQVVFKFELRKPLSVRFIVVIFSLLIFTWARRLSFGLSSVHCFVCVSANYYDYFSAFWARTINRPKANMDSASARRIPFLNLSSSFFPNFRLSSHSAPSNNWVVLFLKFQLEFFDFQQPEE